AGYGAAPEPAAQAARGVIAAGGTGLTVEHGPDEGGGVLVDVTLHVERIRAAREAGAAAGVPIVVNARTDAFEIKEWAPAQRLAEAVRRANAYHAAGADCLSLPDLSAPETIARV